MPGPIPNSITDLDEFRDGTIGENQVPQKQGNTVVGVDLPSPGGASRPIRYPINGRLETDGTNWMSWSNEGWVGDVQWDSTYGAQTGDPNWTSDDNGVLIPEAATLVSVICVFIHEVSGQTYTRFHELWGRPFTSGNELGTAVQYASGSQTISTASNDNEVYRIDMTLDATAIPANTMLRLFSHHTGFTGAYLTPFNLVIDYQPTS